MNADVGALDRISSVLETRIFRDKESGSCLVEKKLIEDYKIYFCSQSDLLAENNDLRAYLTLDPLTKPEKSNLRIFVEGCSISEYFNKSKIKSDNISSSKEVQMIIAYGLCRSILYLHKNREFHGNIKPNNVILRDNIYPVLCDAVPPEVFIHFLSKNVHSSNISEIETNGELYDIYLLGHILKELFSINDMISNDSKLSFIIELCLRKIPKHRPSITTVLNYIEDFSLRSSFDQQKFSFYVTEISKAEGLIEGQDIHSNIYSLRNIGRNFELFHYASTFPSNKDCQIIVSYYNIEHNHFSSEDLRILEENCSQNIYAAYYMSNCLIDAYGFEKDEERAFQLLVDYLSQEHHDSAFYPVVLNLLSFCYNFGIGTEVNESEAFRYYELSANQGYASAQSNLGMCYEEGTGTPVDEKRAFHYYDLAVKQGSKFGLSCLASCYEDGIGTDVDTKKAFFYYELDVNKGNIKSCLKLAQCYGDGIGTEVDEERAFHYYEIAVNNSDSQNSQYSSSCYKNLACCYENGIGIEIDEDKAFYYCELSVNLGDEESLYALGYYYQYGFGTEKDVEKAINLLKMSKIPLSCLELGNIYHKEEQFIDYEKALKYLRLSKKNCEEAGDLIVSLQNSIIPN